MACSAVVLPELGAPAKQHMRHARQVDGRGRAAAVHPSARVSRDGLLRQPGRCSATDSKNGLALAAGCPAMQDHPARYPTGAVRTTASAWVNSRARVARRSGANGITGRLNHSGSPGPHGRSARWQHPRPVAPVQRGLCLPFLVGRVWRQALQQVSGGRGALGSSSRAALLWRRGWLGGTVDGCAAGRLWRQGHRRRGWPRLRCPAPAPAARGWRRWRLLHRDLPGCLPAQRCLPVLDAHPPGWARHPAVAQCAAPLASGAAGASAGNRRQVCWPLTLGSGGLAGGQPACMGVQHFFAQLRCQ